jgi:outer membrane protein W
MKKNIFLTIILLLSISINAQTKSEVVGAEKTYKPKKKDFTVGINFGRSSFITTGLSTYVGSTVNGTASTSVIGVNGNDATNMIGAEGRFFISNNWAISVSGGFAFSNTPGSVSIPAAGSIPAYNAVVEDVRTDISYAVGALYFFNTKSKRLAPYLGVSIPVNHATRSAYDANVNNGTITNLGASQVEVNGVGVQAVAGADYYLTENVYFGLSIKPLSYNVITNTKTPGPGLFTRKVRNYSFSSMVQPLLSVGFKF